MNLLNASILFQRPRDVAYLMCQAQITLTAHQARLNSVIPALFHLQLEAESHHHLRGPRQESLS